MNVLLIEDEWAAAQNLRLILRAIDPNVRVLTVLESVPEAVTWLQTNPAPDLAFVDVQLADGSSFDIFKQVDISFPVVFATAYDEYAIQAFRVNSIDYLLKPIDEAAVRSSLQKYQQLYAASPLRSHRAIQQLLSEWQHRLPDRYKSSFLVHYRDKLLPVEVTTFAYFHARSNVVHGVTKDAKTYLVDYSLEELEKQLAPSDFYRANRQYVVARWAIVDIAFYFNGRLLLNLRPPASEHVLVSKARAPKFRGWMNR